VTSAGSADVAGEGAEAGFGDEAFDHVLQGSGQVQYNLSVGAAKLYAPLGRYYGPDDGADEEFRRQEGIARTTADARAYTEMLLTTPGDGPCDRRAWGDYYGNAAMGCRDALAVLKAGGSIQDVNKVYNAWYTPPSNGPLCPDTGDRGPAWERMTLHAAACTYAVATVISMGLGANPGLLFDAAEISVGAGIGAETQNGASFATEAAAPRMGRSTFGGTDLAAKNMQRFADRYPLEGYTDVIGHGSPNDLAGMSASELAGKLPSGQNVRLLSCQTGCPSGTFAQDLANEMGVRVMAPTTDIGASGSGKTLTIFDGGEFRCFIPGGTGPVRC
jgi:hypothetical protein